MQVYNVIKSCTNSQHLKGALKYYLAFMRLYRIDCKSVLAQNIQIYYNLKKLKLSYDKKH